MISDNVGSGSIKLWQEWIAFFFFSKGWMMDFSILAGLHQSIQISQFFELNRYFIPSFKIYIASIGQKKSRWLPFSYQYPTPHPDHHPNLPCIDQIYERKKKQENQLKLQNLLCATIRVCRNQKCCMCGVHAFALHAPYISLAENYNLNTSHITIIT